MGEKPSVNIKIEESENGAVVAFEYDPPLKLGSLKEDWKDLPETHKLGIAITLKVKEIKEEIYEDCETVFEVDN